MQIPWTPTDGYEWEPHDGGWQAEAVIRESPESPSLYELELTARPHATGAWFEMAVAINGERVARGEAPSLRKAMRAAEAAARTALRVRMPQET